jgi:hypothetical protein
MVTARNSVGAGLPSAPSNSVIPATTPGVPPNVRATAGNGQATISFDPPLSNGGLSIMAYAVTAYPGGMTYPASGSPLTVTGLTNGTAYTFVVTATNGVGTGPASPASNSVVPMADQVPPLVLQVSIYPVGVVGIDYPLQILTAVGGKPPYKFAISNGVLPPGLTFFSPEFDGIPTTAAMYEFTVTVTDTVGSTATGPGSVLVNPANSDIILSQSTLPFYVTVGSGATPAPASVTVRSSVVAQLLNFAVSAPSDAPWLSVVGGGTTPSDIGISLNSAALALPAASTPYKTSVIVICKTPSPCANVAKAINIELNVSAPPPALSLTDSLVSFESAVSAPPPQSRTVGIQNTGGGELQINSITARDPWVTVSAAPGSVLAGMTAPVVVGVDSTGLAAGYYTSSVGIATPAGVAVLAVSLRRAIPDNRG